MISGVKKLKDDFIDYRTERISMKKSFSGSNKNANNSSPSSKKSIDYHHDHHYHNNNRSKSSLASKLNEKISFNKRKHSDQFGRRLGGDHSLSLSDDGIDFRAKLIGIQDVDCARGDLMCQKAMQACKAAIKRVGQRKQRIWFNLSAQGFKIKDQNSEIVLFNFPISKISFIAKDITDDRAFGFVYEGLETNNKFKFYGIKTEKLAEFVVLDIRNMFQMVFEATQQKRSNKEQATKSFEEQNGHKNQLVRRNSDIRNDESLNKRNEYNGGVNVLHSQNQNKEGRNNHHLGVNPAHRTKSVTQIDQLDQLFVESNDLINLNHNGDTAPAHSSDPFDMGSCNTSNSIYESIDATSFYDSSRNRSTEAAPNVSFDNIRTPIQMYPSADQSKYHNSTGSFQFHELQQIISPPNSAVVHPTKSNVFAPLDNIFGDQNITTTTTTTTTPKIPPRSSQQQSGGTSCSTTTTALPRPPPGAARSKLLGVKLSDASNVAATTSTTHKLLPPPIVTATKSPIVGDKKDASRYIEKSGGSPNVETADFFSANSSTNLSSIVQPDPFADDFFK